MPRESSCARPLVVARATLSWRKHCNGSIPAASSVWFSLLDSPCEIAAFGHHCCFACYSARKIGSDSDLMQSYMCMSLSSTENQRHASSTSSIQPGSTGLYRRERQVRRNDDGHRCAPFPRVRGLSIMRCKLSAGSPPISSARDGPAVVGAARSASGDVAPLSV